MTNDELLFFMFMQDQEQQNQEQQNKTEAAENGSSLERESCTKTQKND